MVSALQSPHGGAAGLQNPNDFVATEEATLLDTSSASGWTGLGKEGGSAATVSVDSGAVTATLLAGPNHGGYMSYTFGATQDITPVRFILCEIKWGPGNTGLSQSWVEFRISSGSDLTTLADQHTRHRIYQMIPLAYQTVYIPVTDPTAIKTLGLYIEGAKTLAAAGTHTGQYWIKNLRKMATPKWIRAAEAASSATVFIPAGYTEATADPTYMLPVANKGFVDYRNTVQVTSYNGGRKQVRSFLIDGTGATDVLWPLQQMFDSLNDDDVVEFPANARYRLTATDSTGFGNDAVKAMRAKNVIVHWNNAKWFTEEYPRKTRFLVMDYGADGWTISGKPTFIGRQEYDENPETEWASHTGATTSGAAAERTFSGVGDAAHSFLGRFTRDVDDDLVYDVTLRGTGEVVEIYWSNAPLVLTGNVQDGGTSSTTFTDASADFLVDGVRNGMWVRNTTTKAEGVITSLTATTFQIVTSGKGTFGGGSRATFQNGDVIEIFHRYEPQFTRVEVDGAEVANPQAVALTAGNKVYTVRAKGIALWPWWSYITVRKISGAGTVTVADGLGYQRCRDNANNEFQGGIAFYNCSGNKVYNLWSESMGGDTFEFQGEGCISNEVHSPTGYGISRQGMSPSGGRHNRIFNPKVVFHGRAVIDIEPPTGHVRDLKIYNVDSDGASTESVGTGYALAATSWEKLHDIHIIGWHMKSTDPANDHGNMSDAGWQDGELSGITCNFAYGQTRLYGSNVRVRDIQVQNLYLDSDSSDYDVKGIRPSNSKMASFIRDSGTRNNIEDAPGFQVTEDAGIASTGVGPIDLSTVAPTGGMYRDLDFSGARQSYPETYPARWEGSGSWPAGGKNLFREPIYNLGGLSGRTTAHKNFRGRNFNSNPAASGGSSVSLPATNTSIWVPFPTASQAGRTVLSAIGATSTGTGVQTSPADGDATWPLAGVGYRYRFEPRARDSGPFAVSSEYGTTFTPINGTDWIKINVNSGISQTDHFVHGLTVYRRNVALAVAEARYDLLPNADFPHGKGSSWFFKDRGSKATLASATYGYQRGNYGWPEEADIEQGTVTLTANLYDGAGSNTVFQAAGADFIKDGVRVGFKVTESVGGGTATITAVTKTTITHGALSAGAWVGAVSTLTVTKQWTPVDESGYEPDRDAMIILGNFRPSAGGTWAPGGYTAEIGNGGFWATFGAAPVTQPGLFDWVLLR